MAEITRKRLGELMGGVFTILAKAPEGMAAKDVMAGLAGLVPPTPFEASDYPNRPGVRRYEKIVRFSTVPFVKSGWLVKTKGQWVATDEGLKAFNETGADLEGWYRAAVAKYQAWMKARTAADAEADDVELDSVAAAATLEEASEAALADIRSYLEAMSPYDFQDLVAALIEAMGYHVLWVAPPGPDRGIDIIAGSDPLGVQDPRIKVQVRHRITSTSDVSDLRAFMAVLGPRDVGIYVSVGGFTRDAQSEARNNENRKLTLIDLEQLVELWIAHYDAVDEGKRAMLPLRRVYYLAPPS